MYTWMVKGIKVVISSNWYITIRITLPPLRPSFLAPDPTFRRQSKNSLTLKVFSVK